MKHFIMLLSFAFLGKIVFSQEITGSVTEIDQNKKKSALPFANIYWVGTKISVTADANGMFKIAYPDSMPGKLVASFVGMTPDTIYIQKKVDAKVQFVLRNSFLMPDVVIVGKKQTDSYSIFTPINVQTITKNELFKAACCNLSESFETNATVDVNYTDAVSGAKQIQMLGLDGIYTQLLSENVPLVRGLSTPFGLNHTPGSWVNNIYITKGAGSVVSGYESIAGQIQIELMDPLTADKFFVNMYVNEHTRLELNSHYAKKSKNERVGWLLLLHAGQMQKEHDDNNDTFIDDPLVQQINVLSRWTYNNGKNTEGQSGIKFMNEDRVGGQITKHNHQTIDTIPYSISIRTTTLDLFSKNGFLFPSKPHKSIGIQTAGKYQQYRAGFGKQKYTGDETYAYLNIIHEGIIGNSFHKLKTGASFMADVLKQSLNDSLFDRTEIVPGIFSEYTFSDTSKHSLVIGARADYHNLFGLFFTPRIHYKYTIKDGMAIRLSAGKGTRVSNVIVENMAVLASSRKLQIREKLLPENAINYGVSFIYKFHLFNHRDAAFNADFFRTDFINQIIADYENPDYIAFYNLKGKSFSNAAQVDFSFSPLERWEIKTAYKFYNVKVTYDSVLLDKPMLFKHRAFLNMAYATPYNKWKFDYTIKWTGSARLPSTQNNPAEFQLPTHSLSYITMMAQITKRYKWFDFYLGCENITGYVQNPSVIDSTNPFGSNFDASLVWAPLNNRMIYLGFRYNLK